jgi:hypothetical protein
MSTTRIGIYSPGVGNTLGGCASNWHLFVQRWQHARGLRLEWAFIRLALATRSGAVPRIGIPSPRRWQHARGLHLELAFLRPCVGNTLGGCALQPDASNAQVYAYMLTLAFTSLALGVYNTLGSCASHTANISSPLHCLLHLKQHTVDHVNSGLYC